MKLYKTSNRIIAEYEGQSYQISDSWDHAVNHSKLHDHLVKLVKSAKPLDSGIKKDWLKDGLSAPIGSQEVWASGVTYLRSRDARMEESKTGGGSDFYQKVYDADRPELFFKALAHRVVGHGGEVYIRKDSTWNVPEPELTLFINSKGEIQGYTVGNDMSSRSIEGENPLYLPQAKSYEKACALGPCLYVPKEPISLDTNIVISIKRNGNEVFHEEIQLNRMKRKFDELVEYLYRACHFNQGAYLMTGTGIIPPNEFTLEPKDMVSISIDGIGTLENVVGVI
ncbi:MAG: fumarylacetoacetate hydrolase family protein [Imperialibacter sp.]|uniref:fumarylacetoacetate hydrolase family protein n=1 Tax=Imperialibacter sp. TaxID=2038411 RepID=UPI0030DA75DB|tara:strand:+ start:929 stop:1774 length:846 start_codon:yes stop_codon:yes gene_type:complete